jgi:hypothetical protein
MTVDEGRNDHLFDVIAELRGADVSARHARRLRRRCHALLQTESRPHEPIGTLVATLLRRVVGPALAGAWSVVYLAEIVRRAAAMYRSLP